MSLAIAEWFGRPIHDVSPAAEALRATGTCPFLGSACTKVFSDGTQSGVCSVHTGGSGIVSICPNRFYGGAHQVLSDVAALVFGKRAQLITPDSLGRVRHNGWYVAALGKATKTELRLPVAAGRGSYFFDWILARVSPSGELQEFVAVEIQAIDTTGSYRREVESLRMGSRAVTQSKAGLNWENVNKRTLLQLIYKGQVLRQEPKSLGVVYVCPTQVYSKIERRLAAAAAPIECLEPGSVTFVWYGLDDPADTGFILRQEGCFRTTADRLALAIASPPDLPTAGAYSDAISALLASKGPQRTPSASPSLFDDL